MSPTLRRSSRARQPPRYKISDVIEEEMTMENFWTKPLLYKLPGEHQIRTSLWKVSTFQNDNDLPTIEQHLKLKPTSSLSLVSPSPLGSTESTESTTNHNVVVETSRKTPQQLNFISCSSDSDTPPRPLTPPLTQASSTSTSTSSSSVSLPLPLQTPSLTTPNPPSSTTSSSSSSSPSGTHTTPISPPPRSTHTTRTPRMPPQHPTSRPFPGRTNPKPTNLTNMKQKQIIQTKKKKKNPRSWLRRGIQEDCEVVPMKTGVLYIYRGDHRRVEFVRKK